MSIRDLCTPKGGLPLFTENPRKIIFPEAQRARARARALETPALFIRQLLDRAFAGAPCLSRLYRAPDPLAHQRKEAVG
jgi:hypothetical protein